MTSAANRHLNLETLQVQEVGRLRKVDHAPGVVLLDAAGDAWAPASDWFLQLTADDRSPNTVRALRAVPVAVHAVSLGGGVSVDASQGGGGS